MLYTLTEVKKIFPFVIRNMAPMRATKVVEWATKNMGPRSERWDYRIIDMNPGSIPSKQYECCWLFKHEEDAAHFVLVWS
jgi:hypothetical protein